MFTVIKIIDVLANIFSFAIIGRVLLSWVSPGRERSTPIGQLLYRVTEPFIDLIRVFPHRIGMMDLSPIIAIFAIDLIQFVLKEVLLRLA